MARFGLLSATITLAGLAALAPAATAADFRLALPDHKGQLRWPAEGFKIIQSSAKPNGREIGIRGRDASGRLTFLGFLFLFPELAPLNSAKCRDGVMGPEQKSNRALKILDTADTAQPGRLPVSIVSYTAKARNGSTVYMVRGFVATAESCGDLEFYSSEPISAGDSDLRMIFSSYELDEKYEPKFGDVVFYAQVLFQTHMYKEAAPLFESALAKLPEDGSPFPSASAAKRIVTDQAGMAYGISGDLVKARAIFEKGIVEDPDYPMYYYNLACADAGEKKLADARLHLQQAFDRKANVLAGESIPDPTKDDSFTPYQRNKQFWAFLEQLQANR